MDEERDDDERRGLRVPTLGRFIADSLSDLRGAAGFLRRTLPEVASDLRAIRGHIATMDPEIVGMHASVERVEVEIGVLITQIGALRERMEAVEAAVARLEPHVADVNLAVRPLRRARARFPRADD